MGESKRARYSSGSLTWRTIGLASVMAYCSLIDLPAGFANESDPMITGTLPRGEEVTRQGHSLEMQHEAPPGRLLVLGFVGDLGFSGKDQPLSSAGAIRHGRVIPWADLTAGIAQLLDADATFANLETVVTDRSDLGPTDKAFNFAASSEGLRQAIKAGINVMAAANNHAADYGEQGIADTLRHLEVARTDGLKAYAGLGRGDERYRADTFELQGVSVGLAAVGKGINPAGADGYGQPLYASLLDFQRASGLLGKTGADVRVLSVHYNEELSLLPAVADTKRLRSAIDRGDATIVFGHHSHVPSGVERRGDGVILYGLGNFLHAGTQNMARYGQCRDFGLHARVYLWVAPGDKPILRAVEITPIMDMHEIAKPFPAKEAASRIAIVNAISEELSRDGGDPLYFVPTSSGSGLACVQDPATYGDELDARCKEQLSPLMNVASEAAVSLASCKPLPQVEVAAGSQKNNVKPVALEEQSGKLSKPSKKQASKKINKTTIPVAKDKKRSAGRFFLFSRTD
jgi:poly-gamma-glutamate synthesis protein (capsule biosynthesis protein)